MGLKTPEYKVVAQGKDITDILAKRLISLEITDNSGTDSDAVTITLADDGMVSVPATGAKLEVWLGYKGDLAKWGEFTVDEVELTTTQMIIRAKAADMYSSIKAAKTENWLPPGPLFAGGIVFSYLVNRIASRNNLEPIIADSLKGIGFESIHQTSESDLNLLNRVAKDHGAIAKVAYGKLIVVPRGEAKTATGKAMPNIPVDADVLDWTDHSVTITKRNNYGSVKASYQDTDNGDVLSVTVGENEPVHELKGAEPTKERATEKAKAKLKASQRGSKKLSLSIPGDPRYRAETKVTLVNFRGGVNDTYTLDGVTQTILGGGGYTTTVTGETKSE
jgi:phage protein D